MLAKLTIDIDERDKKQLKPMAKYYGHRTVSPFLALKIAELVQKYKKETGK